MTSERLRRFEWGSRGDGAPVVHDRVLTAANAITVVRLLGLPLFVWLVLERRAYGLAVLALALVAATDWVDGYVARRFDQVTRLGRILDPLVDRVLIATAGITLLVAGVVPWWLVALVVGRDVAVLAGALALFGAIPPIPVTRVGKTATALLLVALPGLLLGHADWAGADILRAGSWVLAGAGVVAYYIAAWQYVRAAARLRAARAPSKRRP